MSQHFLHRTARLFDKAREDGHVANPPPDPLDETRLAAEIARIIEKRPARPAATAKPAAAQWLGEEDDRAFVERYAAAAIVDEVTEAQHGDLATPHTGAALPERSASFTVDWVKKARRQRLHARFRDITGWTVSIAVSLALIIAVGVAMFGWPDGGTILKQLQVKSIAISALDENR